MLFFREIPQELIREARGGEVNLNMEDHRAEDYVKPKVPTKAFTGEGNVLGRYFKSKLCEQNYLLILIVIYLKKVVMNKIMNIVFLFLSDRAP